MRFARRLALITITPRKEPTMRRVRYNVAASLDGFIADASDGYDWIPNDETVDFAGLFARIDTVLIGRKTWEVVADQTERVWKPDARVFVFSRTMRPDAVPGVTIVRDDPVTFVSSLRHEPGDGEIWLFGGGQLFAALLAGGQVDAVEVTVVPVLLGGGVPLLPEARERSPLELVHTHVYPSGMVGLHYSVPGAAR
jgi:dihydrofolate reductase